MKKLSVYISLLALFLIGGAVQAQEAPRPEVVFREWRQSQVSHGREIAPISFEERATYEMDGPFGTRQAKLTADVVGDPVTGRWKRELVTVRVDGRPVDPERWKRVERHHRQRMGERWEQLMAVITLSPRWLARLRPVGDVSRESVTGVSCWRFDLVPPGKDGPLERVTLWFDRDRGSLRRTRTLIQTSHLHAPLVVVTDYRRLEGLDLPRQRHVEGTLQVKRRRRTYTLLFEYEATYAAYRFGRN